MAPNNYRSNNQSLGNLPNFLQPSIAFVVMIFGALIAFEVFNYSTTDHALRDLLGDLKFAGIPWATILALAFCGIDFAGIARLFTPEQGADEPKEVWYLFGAWLLAATMNAILTWWGVSMAVVNHNPQSSSVLDPQMVNNVVPVFVAIMVWVIRILIIGTLSMAMDRLLHPGAEKRMPIQNAFDSTRSSQQSQRASAPPQPVNIPSGLSNNSVNNRQTNAARSMSGNRNNTYRANDPDDFDSGSSARTYQEPTYHSLSATGRVPVNRPKTGGESGGSDSNNRARRY